MTQAVAQLNVRIPQQVKAEGDAALSALGVSTTEFMRALWEKLAAGGEGRDEVVASVLGGDVDVSARSARMAALSRARALYEDGMARLGINPDAMDGAPGEGGASDREAYVDALLSRMAERGTR